MNQPNEQILVTSAGNQWHLRVHPILNELEYLALTLGRTKATRFSFRTLGQAIGWIKRLAKSEPGGEATFNIVCWAAAEQPWDIYFE